MGKLVPERGGAPHSVDSIWVQVASRPLGMPRWHGVWLSPYKTHHMSSTYSPAAKHLGYSASDLAEFKALIQLKLANAEVLLQSAKDSVLRSSSSSTDDTYTGISNLEDVQASIEREDMMRVVERQGKFIQQLKGALDRIRTGQYGICKVTGELIPKERLRLVPHATMSIAAKEAQVTRP